MAGIAFIIFNHCLSWSITQNQDFRRPWLTKTFVDAWHQCSSDHVQIMECASLNDLGEWENKSLFLKMNQGVKYVVYCPRANSLYSAPLRSSKYLLFPWNCYDGDFTALRIPGSSFQNTSWQEFGLGITLCGLFCSSEIFGNSYVIQISLWDSGHDIFPKFYRFSG